MKVNLRKSEVSIHYFLDFATNHSNIFAGASRDEAYIPVDYFDSSARAIDEIQILLDNDFDMTNSGQHSSCPSARKIVGEG